MLIIVIVIIYPKRGRYVCVIAAVMMMPIYDHSVFGVVVKYLKFALLDVVLFHRVRIYEALMRRLCHKK
jgi:hypothetical protein